MIRAEGGLTRAGGGERGGKGEVEGSHLEESGEGLGGEQAHGQEQKTHKPHC
jgi:hypothetical protein